MGQYTKEELEGALRSITSTINKCEKAQQKLTAGTSQHTRLVRELKAYYISIALIKRESNRLIGEKSFAGEMTKEELEEAVETIASMIRRCEDVLPKLKAGSSQETLTVRRIKAFHIATDLIKNT